MSQRRSRLLLRIAAVFALIGLALMIWSLLHPAAFPIIMAMTVGQGIGVLSLLLYLGIVLADLRTSNVLPDLPEPPPLVASSAAATGQYAAVRDDDGDDAASGATKDATP